MKFDNLKDVVGTVISESPFVKILAEPTYEEWETVPGIVDGRWTAVANVNGTLCIVELKIKTVD